MWRSKDHHDHYRAVMEMFTANVVEICSNCDSPIVQNAILNLENPVACPCRCDRISRMIDRIQVMQEDLAPVN